MKRGPVNLRTVFALSLAAGVCLPQARAQSIQTSSPNERPGVGGSLGVTAKPHTDPSSGTYTRHHRSATGAACLTLWGGAKPFTNNANLFNHWVYAKNQCSERIRIKVCYYSSRNCIDMDVPGHEKKEAILGTLPSVKDFKYEYTERF